MPLVHCVVRDLQLSLCQLIQSNGMKNQIHSLLKENKRPPNPTCQDQGDIKWNKIVIGVPTRLSSLEVSSLFQL